MNTIKLQAYAWISGAMGTADNQNQTLKIEVAEGATVFDLFSQLAAQYPGFKEKVFNPAENTLSDQVMIIADGKLVQQKDLKNTVLGNNQTVVLSPVLVGG